MKTRTEWIVAALLMGACGGTERIEGRAASIEPEKALLASAKRAEAEVEARADARAAEVERAAHATVATTGERSEEAGASPRTRVRPPKPRPGARAEPEIVEPMPEYRPVLRAMPRWQIAGDPHGPEGGW